MEREFTGSTDKFDNKLYIGDKVKALNGAIGTISKYSSDPLGDAIGNKPRKRNQFLEKIF